MIEQAEKCVCKIKCKDGSSGTGFFCLIPFPDKTIRLRTLMTNNHVLQKKDIEIGEKIEFSISDDKIKFNIIIDKSRKVFTDETYDITIIEIKKEDRIKDDSFLEIDDEIFKENIIYNFKEKPIYLLHYPKGQNVEKSEGSLKYISEDYYNILHSCSTSPGSSGSPILSLNNNRLIGIHKRRKRNVEYNGGTLLKLPIEKFNEEFNDKKKNLNKSDIENHDDKIPQIKEDNNKKIISNFNENININNNIIGNVKNETPELW